MFFHLFSRKKTKRIRQEDIYEPLQGQEKEESPKPQEKPSKSKHPASKEITSKHHIIELCEELIDAAREIEDQKAEYQNITDQLNEIQRYEESRDVDKEEIVSAAQKMLKLDIARSQFLSGDRRLSDKEYALFQEEEEEMSRVIRRLQANEKYLAAIQKDMNLLEGEKVEWVINKEDCREEQKNIRSLSVILLILFAFLVLLLFLLYYLMGVDTQFAMVATAFFAVIFGSVAILRYQDCNAKIKQSDVNRNAAINLENKVKIKYVNIKNAVDYTCSRFGVKNSYELVYQYEQYQEMKKEKQRFRQTSDELIYYNEKLEEVLRDRGYIQIRMFASNLEALINKDDLIELKHRTLVHRQKLRSKLEYSSAAITDLRDEIEGYIYSSGQDLTQVRDILKRIDQLHMKDIK